MARVSSALTLFAVLFPLALTLDVNAQEGGAPVRAVVSGAGDAGTCLVSGRVTSGGIALPGVVVAVRVGETAPRVTSSDVEGRFEVRLSTGATNMLGTELTGFTPTERIVEVGASCPALLDVQLAVAPRTPPASPGADGAAGGRRGRGNFAGAPGASVLQRPQRPSGGRAVAAAAHSRR